MSPDGKFDEEGNMKAAEKAFKGDEAKMKKAKGYADACKDKSKLISTLHTLKDETRNTK